MKRTLCVCCAAHFGVDFACAFLLFRALRGEVRWAELLLLYNFCAFAVQMPLGVLADRWKRDGTVAAAGALLVAAGCLVPGVPALTVLLAGLGNAAFHVGGGLAVLEKSGDRAGPLGLFVSPGALGLFLGTWLGKGGTVPLFLPPLVLLGLALLLRHLPDPLQTDREVPPRSHGPERAVLPLALLLSVVVLRSWVGMSLTFPWKGTGHWALCLTVSLALGKAAGGYLADRFGPMRTAAVSLTLSAALLLGSGWPVWGVLAVFLFNMTMPLTLWACARLLPGSRGFAFGLLTFGLFLGFLPTAFGAPGLSGGTAAGLALVSLLLLWPGLRRAVGK